MTTAPTMPAFGRGGDEAEAVAAAQGGGNFARVGYFALKKPGDQMVLRFLTEQTDWIYVNQHTGCPTKGKPEGWGDRAWPKSMTGVCRYDKAFAGMYSDCYICDKPIEDPFKPGKALKATSRVWALAVVREAVIDPDTGRTMGYRDATEEVDEYDADGKETGNKIKRRKIIYVNQAMNNFFSGLNGIKALNGTIRDRDIAIIRKGEGKDAMYNTIPVEKIPGHEPGSESWKKYEDMLKEENIDLAQIVWERANDDYFAKFFDARVVYKVDFDSKATGGTSSPAPAQGQAPAQQSATQAPTQTSQGSYAPAPSEAETDDALAAMRARVQNYAPGQAAQQPAEQPQQATTPPAAPAAQEQPAAPAAPQEQAGGTPSPAGEGSAPINYDA